MAKVRGNGSTIQLDKTKKTSVCQKWELRVNVGRDLSTDVYKPLTRRFTGTLTEAKKALREFISEIERGDVQRRSDMKFGKYCEAWLTERKQSVAFGTYRSDVDRMKNVSLLLRNARLDEITPSVLESLYKRLMNGESVSGRKLSSNYVSDISRTLHRLFRDAVRDGHIPSNPCDFAEKPKIERDEKKSIKANEISELLDKLDPTQPSELVIITALRTGMRRGEVHGLSWGDIDFDGMQIHVCHNYDVGGNLKAPKTHAGIRDIPMTPNMADAFKQRLDYLSIQAENLGLALNDKTPVICNEALERELPSSSTRWWTRNRKALGFDGYTIHEMRHSFLSEMARRKVDPKVLQKLAGHAKYSTTMDIYTHVDMEDKREAMKKMDW